MKTFLGKAILKIMVFFIFFTSKIVLLNNRAFNTKIQEENRVLNTQVMAIISFIINASDKRGDSN